jgi:hypothetical protein
MFAVAAAPLEMLAVQQRLDLYRYRAEQEQDHQTLAAVAGQVEIYLDQ